MCEDKIVEITRKLLNNEDNRLDLYRQLIESLPDTEVYCPVRND